MSQKEQLQKNWKELGFENRQYISKPQLVSFIQNVLMNRKIMDVVPNHTELEKMIDQYVQEIHEVNANTITNIEFKFQESVQFYQWLTGKQINNASKVTNIEEQSLEKKEEPPKEQEKEKQEVKKEEKDKEMPKQQEKEQEPKVQENKQQEKKEEPRQQVQETKNEEPQEQEKQQKEEEKPEEQQNYLYPHNVQTQENNKRSQENQNQFNEFADDEELSKNQQILANNDKISSNYRQFLNIIFDHYCRMSYATGNDPTFQQIQQKTQIMTINKFMIFCKEFGIMKLSNMTRNGLVQIFKKNSQYFKQMNFQQFLKVLIKISKLVFGDEDAEGDEKGKQFERMLLFLQVNNATVFKKKMLSLNISYRVKGNNNQQKKQPINYKFKYLSNNGKSEEQVKNQIQERKQIRSEKKLVLQQSLSKNKLDRSKNNVKKENEERNVKDRPQLHSTPGPTQKNLAPPKPPARKSVKGSRSQTLTNVTGYSNIHRLKMKKQLLQDNNIIDPRLKLNSIVQQARKGLASEEGYENLHYSKINGSKQSLNRKIQSSQAYSNLGYRYLNELSERNDLLAQSERESQVKYIYGQQRIPLQRSHLQKDQNDLDGLIDNDSDEDQFLAEHLEREKKNDHVAQRIEAKIQQIKGLQDNQS